MLVKEGYNLYFYRDENEKYKDIKYGIKL
jgi:hypothetical protein